MKKKQKNPKQKQKDTKRAKQGKMNVQTRRMTSIARKMHRSWIGKKLGLYVGMDLLLFVLLFAGWIIDREIVCFGEIRLDYVRRFAETQYLQNVTYVVQEGTGKILLELALYPTAQVIGAVVLAIFICQLLNICFSYGSEERKIRKILAPIDEIALKADELSKMTFTEEKYQQIEEAISSLQPEDADLLSFGDADLQGIEAAMNNLLIRMRDSYRQQARFVNDASHELRTPIAVIQGYANMLARWGREDEKVLDESINAIQHESDHMQHLVEQLLFLARGDSGRQKLTMTTVSLNDMMQEVYEESLMIDENHPYYYQMPEEKIYIRADAAMLKQAVRILVDNAAKYTENGGEILLGVGRSGDGCAWLQVQDAGIGMAEKDVAQMFERFFRADDARRFQGTGLGLSIAKWIIDKHHGHFEVLSRTQLGTRIRVVLDAEKGTEGQSYV